jgi:hypothetical protein
LAQSARLRRVSDFADEIVDQPKKTTSSALNLIFTAKISSSLTCPPNCPRPPLNRGGTSARAVILGKCKPNTWDNLNNDAPTMVKSKKFVLCQQNRFRY